MTAHVRISPQVDDLDTELDVRVYASLFRALEAAPIERKPALFSLMARYAAGEIAARKQQAVDDLWRVAEKIGLVSLLGATSVQDTLASAFEPFELRAQQ